MTINTFVLKGDLNGKIAFVRFFFCRVYIGLWKRDLAALLLLSFKDCVVALPHGAMICSAVCDISQSYSLTF